MASFPEQVGGWLLDLVGFVGLALGGGQAAATGLLNELQQDSWREAATGTGGLTGATRGRVLTPAELAQMVIKDVLHEDEASTEALFSGMGRDRFHRLVLSTGNPPGPAELITMLRRRINTEEDVIIGLKQGYTKPEWIDRILALRHDPFTPSEAVQAAVQGHVGYEWAADEADRSGMDRNHFDIAFQTAGNPPGPMEVLNLWNRGDITEAQVIEALKESRLKDKWIPAVMNLARRRIPMRTITTLVRHGALTDAQAIENLQVLGYTPTDAAAIVQAGHALTAQPHKELSVATIKAMYVDHLIDKPTGVADLVKIGYTPEAATQILDLAEHDIAARDRRGAITKVQAAFLSRRIDAANASGDLDALGVPADQRDALIRLWTIEQANNVAMLTPAQIVAAGRLKIFDELTMLARLVEHGYTPEDAVIVGMIGKAIQLPPTP